MLRHYKALSLLTAVAVASASFAVATMPAYAQTKPVVVYAERAIPTRVVSYRDLNLAKARDQNILYRRVRIAVGEVCDESSVTVAEFGYSGACRHLVWNEAHPQVARAIGRARAGTASRLVSTAALAITISAPKA